MLVFEERGKPEYPEKNLSEQGREPTTNSTHICAGSGNPTRDTLVGGERSHHCAIPAPHMSKDRITKNNELQFPRKIACIFTTEKLEETCRKGSMFSIATNA